jgi:hypothetical protein
MLIFQIAEEIYSGLMINGSMNLKDAENRISIIPRHDQIAYAQRTKKKEVLVVLAGLTAHQEVVLTVLNNPVACNGYLKDVLEAIRQYRFSEKPVCNRIMELLDLSPNSECPFNLEA